jgi:hypothetical protein
LKGLEVSILSLRQVLADNGVARVDPEYFAKENLALAKKLGELSPKRLSEVAFVTDGIHTSIDFCEGSGIRVISAKHPHENFFELVDCEEISPDLHAANPRTALRARDVVVSTVGTIGNCAVVQPEMLPANSDRHVGIVRPQKDFPPEFVSTFLLSRYGRFQTKRESTGNVQLSLFISKLNDIRIPLFTAECMNAVAKTVKEGNAQLKFSYEQLQQAEGILLAALGLGDWQPPEPLTYTRHVSEAFGAKRLDSQYFAPRVAELIARLGTGGRTVRDVALPRRENFFPSRTGDFRYIEISDVHSDGTASCTTLTMRDAPSRATQFVRIGDVLTSTVRPNRRLSAIVSPKQDGCVASSGFVVLQPGAVPAEVLLTYLRLPLLCELMDLHTSASLYPAISERDLLALPFPKISKPTCDKIVSAVRSAHAARARARELLDRAKRAVGIAIEQDEKAGMKLLER